MSLAASGSLWASRALAAPALLNGCDISWLPDAVAAGKRFRLNTGVTVGGVALLKKRGIALGRVRVFVNPTSRNGSLARAINLSRQLKSHGRQVCIDLHYSDTWADPGHQATPADWSHLGLDELANQVYEYTSSTLRTLRQNGVTPAWVQIGNEVTNGMLWPLGSLEQNDEISWQSFVKLFNAGVLAVREQSPKSKVLLHLDCGGDAARVDWWLTRAQAAGLSHFDAVGLSYYSQWHGDLAKLQSTLRTVAVTHKKPVIVVETAYPWTTQTFTGDVINPRKSVLPGYPATPAGQARYLREIQQLLRSLPSNRGIGVWWWEGLAQGFGTGWISGMENSTLVRTGGTELPALAQLGRV